MKKNAKLYPNGTTHGEIFHKSVLLSEEEKRFFRLVEQYVFDIAGKQYRDVLKNGHLITLGADYGPNIIAFYTTFLPNVLRFALLADPQLAKHADGTGSERRITRKDPAFVLEHSPLYKKEFPRTFEALAKDNKVQEIRALLAQCIAGSESDPEAKAQAQHFFEAQFDTIASQLASICEKLGKTPLLMQLANNDPAAGIEYTPEEAKLLITLFRHFFHNELDNFHPPKRSFEVLNSEVVKSGMDALAAKMEHNRVTHAMAGEISAETLRKQVEFEQQRRAARATKKAEETLKKSAELKAVQDAANKAEEDFKNSPEPKTYTIKPSAVYDRICAGFSNTAHGETLNFCARAASETARLIDLRPDRKTIQTIGDIVLSDENLKTATHALVADKPLATVHASWNIGDGPTQLQNMYRSVPAAHEVLDRLANNPSGALFLSALLLRSEQCKAYAITSHQQQAELMGAKEAMKATHNTIATLSTEELHTLADEPEVLTFNAERDRYLKAHKAQNGVQKEIAEVLKQRLAGTLSKKRVHLSFNGNGAHVANGEAKGLSKGCVPGQIEKAGLQGVVELEASGDEGAPIRVYSVAHPVTCSFTTRGKDPEDILNKLGLLKATSHQRDANAEVIPDLIAKGFKYEGPVLVHPEYGIRMEEIGAATEASIDKKRIAENNRSVALLNARSEFELAQVLQNQVLTSAVGHGVVITDANGRNLSTHRERLLPFTWPITTAVEGDKAQTLTFGSNERPYLSTVDLDVIEGLARKKLQAAQTQALETHFHIADEEAARQVEQPQEFVLDPKRTPLLYDTSTFLALAAPRTTADGKASNWLPMLKQLTARLPTTQIVVSSVVANLELCGEVPIHDAQGRYVGSECVNKMLPDREMFGKFFKDATRARIVDGKLLVDKQGVAQSPIMIVETEGDKELWQRIEALRQKSTSPDDLRRRLGEEIYKRDEGELAINRVVQELPTSAPMIIVSDDWRYISGHNLLALPPERTGKNAPVGRATVRDYIEAETRFPIRPAGKSQAFAVQLPSFDELEQILVQHMGRRLFSANVLAGSLGLGPDLKDVIKRGVEQWKAVNNVADGNGKSHVAQIIPIGDTAKKGVA